MTCGGLISTVVLCSFVEGRVEMSGKARDSGGICPDQCCRVNQHAEIE